MKAEVATEAAAKVEVTPQSVKAQSKINAPKGTPAKLRLADSVRTTF